MTVSTQVATKTTVDETVLGAYQLAGIIDADGTMTFGQRAMGRQKLDRIIDQLTGEGVQARFVVFFNQTLVAGTFQYVLPEQYIDVIGDGAYIDPTNTDLDKATGETPVRQVDRATWNRYSSKGAQGRPYNYYPHRAGPGYQIEIILWPIPAEAATIRFQLQRQPADTLDGNVTIDLQQYWADYVDHRLAYVLATSSSVSLQRCATIREEAKRLKTVAVAWANEHTDTFTYNDHGSPWEGR